MLLCALNCYNLTSVGLILRVKKQVQLLVVLYKIRIVVVRQDGLMQLLQGRSTSKQHKARLAVVALHHKRFTTKSSTSNLCVTCTLHQRLTNVTTGDFLGILPAGALTSVQEHAPFSTCIRRRYRSIWQGRLLPAGRTWKYSLCTCDTPTQAQSVRRHVVLTDAVKLGVCTPAVASSFQSLHVWAAYDCQYSSIF